MGYGDGAFVARSMRGAFMGVAFMAEVGEAVMAK